MKAIAKHLLTGLIFTAILALLLLLLSRIMMPKSSDEFGTVFDVNAGAVLGEPENTIDALFIGDSEVYASIMPTRIWEEHGITSYCCSTPGQKLAYSLEFLKNAFEKQSPEYVFIETNALYRIFSFDDSLIYRAGMVMPVFKYHDRWKSMTWEDLDITAGTEYTYTDRNKGYKFYKKILPAKNFKDYMKADSGTEDISQRNRSYISEIASFCEKHGAKLVLISAPSAKNWNMKRHNAVKKLADSLGTEYIDLNLLTDEIPVDWTNDTFDGGDHTNYFGAVKVTDYIGRYLKDTCKLPDRRGEPALDSWNEDAESFNKYVEKQLKKSK